MGIAETHFNNIKGDGVGVVIIANVPVNCEHKQLEGRCVRTLQPVYIIV